MKLVDSIETLKSDLRDFEAIVVEGYDNVGKGRILEALSEAYDVHPYRPDYNLWQSHELKCIDRWKISGYFWDIYNHFKQCQGDLKKPMIFDRGCISGAVYNSDYSIVETYKDLICGIKVMHILVVVNNKEEYRKMLSVRGLQVDVDQAWSQYVEITSRYMSYLEFSGLEFRVYVNYYNEDIGRLSAITCGGCGHYAYGVCSHPMLVNQVVDKNSKRCMYSKDKEVQDCVK